MRDRHVDNITRYMQEYTGKNCIFVPSCRFALYLAFKCFLKPQAKILMSPVNDDVIFFTVLASGLRPVMAPLSDKDGNIDPARISDADWDCVDAIMTTNLHGFPDKALAIKKECERHNVLFIEDVAHAFKINIDGRPVGSFGQVSTFSFSKHFHLPGGALCFDDDGMRDKIEALLERSIQKRSALQLVDDAIRPAVLKTLDALRLRRMAKNMRDILKPRLPERVLWRMDLRQDELRNAIRSGGLERFETWIRVDGEFYRTWQSKHEIQSLTQKFGSLDIAKEERIKGLELLRELDVAPDILRDREPQAVLRVPLLVKNRNEIANLLSANGISTSYIYDPPLDDYAGPEFTDISTNPDNARWWARHVLPIHPLEAVPFLRLVKDLKVDLVVPEPVKGR